MIYGIGNDLIEIDRVVQACQKKTFLNRIFTKQEQKLIEQDSKKAAGNFAVKEAVSKMFGTGFRNVTPIEIEVLRDSLGKPYVVFYGEALKLVTEQGLTVYVSISNTKLYASAVAIGEVKT